MQKINKIMNTVGLYYVDYDKSLIKLKVVPFGELLEKPFLASITLKKVDEDGNIDNIYIGTILSTRDDKLFGYSHELKGVVKNDKQERYIYISKKFSNDVRVTIPTHAENIQPKRDRRFV